MLPNVIILGAPKSGTTSTHLWITDHPDVAGPAVKETEYFVDKSSHAYRSESNFMNQGLPGYERFFEDAEALKPKVVIEAGPDYMYQQIALQELPDLETKPKFLFVLREPAAQIYSLFHYLRNNWQYLPRSMTFSEYIALVREGSPTLAHHELLHNAIDNARYLIHIEKWIERAGEDRVRVYLFDDLVRDSRKYIERLCQDLEIDPAFYENYGFKKGNETYRVRSHALQKLNVKIRSKLPRGKLYDWVRATYRSYNTESGKGEMTAEEAITIENLKQEFAADNNALAERFQLDLSSWRNAVPAVQV